MSVDLEIDIHCRRCGLTFKRAFREMPIGKVLKCPFCYSVSLSLADEGTLRSGPRGTQRVLERVGKGAYIERKLK